MDAPFAGALIAISALATAALIALLLRSGLASRLLDEPVDRSLHDRPTPRVGGLALCPVVGVATWLTGGPSQPVLLWLALLAVFLISVRDDWRALPAGLRLAVHLGAAIVWASHLWASGLAWLPAALALAWMANLFNFMDGADGLAGSMAVIGFGVLGGLAWTSGHPLAVPALAACGAALGFLCFNFPPARLFMGDAGSVPLGFLAAALGLWGVRDGLWSLWVPALAFAPFIADATLTLLGRVVRGRKPWQAHREHLYQRWVLQGRSHRALLAVAVPLMVVCASLAVCLHRVPLAEQTGWGAAACLLLATGYIVLRMRVAPPRGSRG